MNHDTIGAAEKDGTIRVLVADDQRVVREGLVMLLGLLDDIVVVGAAANGKEAVELTLAFAPDVVLMDLRMPILDGVAATRQIRDTTSSSVVVLTTYVDDESLFPALEAGASGYLTKDASAEQIEAAIRAVHAGETWLEPIVQERLIAAVREPKGEVPTPRNPLPDGLTTREAEVLVLIAGGLSNSEIGERLFVGKATVKTHINRIFAKTGVRDRAQLVGYAYRTGLAASPQ
jgi:DNA-binding NarL/FixJ family response regulator